MKVGSRKEAWNKADVIFPTDYIKDEIRSERAGYDVYYGTIPMVDIDENGYLKRRLNGAEMAIEDSISKAIESRKRHIKARKWKQRHPEASEIDLARYILSLIEE